MGGRFSVSRLRTEREELLRGRSSELAHTKARDNETGVIHLVNDFASLDVSVGLDDRKSILSVVSEEVTRGNISIIYKLELPGEDGNNGANKEFVASEVGALHALKEHLASFHIVHLNCVVLRVEGKKVLADELSSLIEPFRFKHEAFLN